MRDYGASPCMNFRWFGCWFRCCITTFLHDPDFQRWSSTSWAVPSCWPCCCRWAPAVPLPGEEIQSEGGWRTIPKGIGWWLHGDFMGVHGKQLLGKPGDKSSRLVNCPWFAKWAVTKWHDLPTGGLMMIRWGSQACLWEYLWDITNK